MDTELVFLYKCILKKKHSIIGQSNFYQNLNNMFVIVIETSKYGKIPIFLGRDNIDLDIGTTIRAYEISRIR